MKYLSICSGIEAASVAWTPLGWSPVAFAEIEPFPRAVLAHHYPEVPNLGDITKFRDWPNLDFDVLVGGTPCQSFSVAGLRAGLADPRGNLALTYLAIADRYRPRWVVWENVPGVRSVDGGRAFGAFLGGLGELGYGWAYRSLDAQYFGLAQRRERVFVVGHLGDWRRAAAVLFEPESMRGDSPPRRETGEGVAPTIASRPTGGGGLGTDFDCDGGLISHALSAARNAACANAADLETYISVAMALNAKGGTGRSDAERKTFVTHSLRADGFDASEDGTGRGTPLVSVFDPNQITSKANRSVPTPGLFHTLPGTSNSPVAFTSRDHGADDGDLSPTLRAMGHAGSHANAGEQVAVALADTFGVGANQTTDFQSEVAAYRGGVRRLTTRECERLQGFPDDYTLVPHRGKPASDGPRYKALGNSMAVPVVRWIGLRLGLVNGLGNENKA